VSESLTARLSELRARVQRAEEVVQRYRMDNDILGAGGRLVQEQQLTDLNNQLTAARVRTAEARARYDQLLELERTGGGAGATSEAVQSNTIGRLREQYAVTTRVEAALSAKLGPLHPDYLDARAQAANAKRLVAEELSRIAEAQRIDYERALA